MTREELQKEAWIRNVMRIEDKTRDQAEHLYAIISPFDKQSTPLDIRMALENNPSPICR